MLNFPGLLLYYQAQINDLVQYPDLRTEVFQSFREIGNAIVFITLVEQSLVSGSYQASCLFALSVHLNKLLSSHQVAALLYFVHIHFQPIIQRMYQQCMYIVFVS